MKILCDCKVQTAQNSNILANPFFSAEDILDWVVIVPQIAEQETSEKSLPLQSPISRVIGPENTHLWYRALIHHAVTHFSQTSTKTEFKHLLLLIWRFGRCKISRTGKSVQTKNVKLGFFDLSRSKMVIQLRATHSTASEGSKRKKRVLTKWFHRDCLSCSFFGGWSLDWSRRN